MSWREPGNIDIAVGSKARISKERVLAFSLWFALMAHGLFYLREWLVLGVVLGFFLVCEMFSFLSTSWPFNMLVPWLSRRLRGTVKYSPENPFARRRPGFDAADALFPGLIALSLAGLYDPVKAEIAYWEALRWAVLWLIMRWSRASASQGKVAWLERQVIWAALVLALAGWVPWVAHIWSAPPFPEAGRLSSLFGYPNAAAAFLGAALILKPGLWWQRAVLFFSLLGTGSRGAVLLYLGLDFLPAVWSKLRLHLNQVAAREPVHGGKGRLVQHLAALVVILVLALLSRPAWSHLLVWGFGTPSWVERLWYWHDGIALAVEAKGLPRAGGWLAFPLIQDLPYWTVDPHSSLISVLVNQGLIGVLLLGALLVSGWRRGRSGQAREQRRRRRALLLLLGHSLVDADFSFGALGILFWLLFGLEAGSSNLQPVGKAVRSRLGTWLTRTRQGSRIVGLGIRVLGLVAVSSVLFIMTASLMATLRLPQWAQGEMGSHKAQATVQQPGSSAVDWERALAWDQTQTAWRREWATDLLRQGKLADGLRQLELVLQWDSWSIGSYEWAQGLLWETAEALRDQGRANSAQILYRQVAAMPERIKVRRESVPTRYRQYWQGYSAFVPTEHLEFLAETARGRLASLGRR